MDVYVWVLLATAVLVSVMSFSCANKEAFMPSPQIFDSNEATMPKPMKGPSRRPPTKTEIARVMATLKQLKSYLCSVPQSTNKNVEKILSPISKNPALNSAMEYLMNNDKSVAVWVGNVNNYVHTLREPPNRDICR